ncbi:hypothetical protein QTP70_031042 [Hemibagrus guttatus]|uniref:Uncharacterized protein n=1 Tax=Hemibagrus guttatus TaxID=175788 RepID=A0AAE0V4H1_9TELE|nr:hypothetical protein QTP70_031042 [Hemibagrus guttatus]
MSNRFALLSEEHAEKPERALVIGDSILRHVKLARPLGAPAAQVRCIPGARVPDIAAYRPLVRCSKPVLKQVKTWPAGTISALQDCFGCTDWKINLEEYTTSVTSYIRKCINDVTVSKTITTHSNQKLWMTAEVRALLKSRD